MQNKWLYRRFITINFTSPSVSSLEIPLFRKSCAKICSLTHRPLAGVALFWSSFPNIQEDPTKFRRVVVNLLFAEDPERFYFQNVTIARPLQWKS